MTESTESRLLAAYSGVLTVVFAVTVFGGMTRGRHPRFDEIDVGRVNIVEPDGTPRMVLSSRARFPGLILRNREYTFHDRQTGGMLFFNDDGTESGGLTFGGSRNPDGHLSAYNHLSFDQFEQDQVIMIDNSDSGELHKAALSVWDRPDYPTVELAELAQSIDTLPREEQRARIHAFLEGREQAHPRMWLGRSQSGAVSLRLADEEGRDRLVVEVGADGTAAMRFLDEGGKEVARFPAADGAP